MTQKKTEERIKSSVVITAIISLALLGAWALYQGINGTLYTAIAAIIAGLAGWVIPFPVKK